MRLFQPGLLWASFVLTATAQTPGPSFPGCAKTSTTLHPGFEVLYFFVESTSVELDDVTVYFSLRNIADRSISTCILSKTVTDDDIYITETDGNCFTSWTDDEKTAEEAPGVKIKLDWELGVWNIEQTWQCDKADGIEARQYTGKAETQFALACALLDVRRIICEIQTATPPDEPLYVGPANVTGHGSSNDTDIAFEPARDDSCESTVKDFTGWQILRMEYLPPTTRNSTLYPTTYISLEIQNLGDGSITDCYFETNKTIDEGEAFVLTDNGRYGCETGHIELAKNAGTRPPLRRPGQGLRPLRPSAEQWQRSTTANVTFDTKSHELSVEQFWSCDGEKDAYYAAAVQKLDFECVEFSDDLTPTECKPMDALYNADGPPVIISAEAQDAREEKIAPAEGDKGKCKKAK